jgi:hypothetical protein
LQSQIDSLAEQSAYEREELRNELKNEKTERQNEAKAMQDLFR